MGSALQKKKTTIVIKLESLYHSHNNDKDIAVKDVPSGSLYVFTESPKVIQSFNTISLPTLNEVWSKKGKLS